ncbi:hypothetical protein [Paenibacillus lautus]|uniref:hypothetical protein n=1 Tax=Paenibacillus lautus TaxID=1401 RepID=UPI003D2B49DF
MVVDAETRRREGQRLAAREVTVKEIAKKYNRKEGTVRGWRRDAESIEEELSVDAGGNELHKLRKENVRLKGQVQSLLKTVSQLALNQK